MHCEATAKRLRSDCGTAIPIPALFASASNRCRRTPRLRDRESDRGRCIYSVILHGDFLAVYLRDELRRGTPGKPGDDARYFLQPHNEVVLLAGDFLVPTLTLEVVPACDRW